MGKHAFFENIDRAAEFPEQCYMSVPFSTLKQSNPVL